MIMMLKGLVSCDSLPKRKMKKARQNGLNSVRVVVQHNDAM